MPGCLYIVATPIGNLEDISIRALSVLKQVDYIAAEDTRHSIRLLNRYGIKQRMLSLHQWNENNRAHEITQRLKHGHNIALISDAGTPLISDPGFPLIRLVRQEKLKVIVVPGPCALIAALSVAGIPACPFVFEGFLPQKGEKRLKQLRVLEAESRTLVLYESCHRIIQLLQELQTVFAEDRQICLARELTKTYETVIQGAANELLHALRRDPQQVKGEFVVIIAGQIEREATVVGEAHRVLAIMLEELSVKQAVKLTHKLTGFSRKKLYEKALESKNA